MDNQAQLLVRDQESYLFLETPSKKLLLPSTRVQPGEDFHGAAERYISEKLCLNCSIQGIVKVQHYTGKVVKQTEKLTVTFVAEKHSGRPNLGTCSLTLRWIPVSEVKGLSSFVLDGSVKLLIQSVHSGGVVYPASLVECSGLKKSGGVPRRESEMGVRGVMSVSEKEVTLEDQMLEQSGYTSHELQQISEEYKRRCGREGVMNEDQFTALLTQLGYPIERCPQCFRTLSSTPDADQISFKELAVGLCALDPSTPHGSLSAQFRCQFIFAFYNTLRTGVLNFEEFKEMMVDICAAKKVSLSEREVEQATHDNWKVFDVPPGDGIPLAKFLHVVGQLKFRGTSVLLRLPRCPVVKKATKTGNDAREPSPAPGVSPGPTTEQSENKSLKSPKVEKKVFFVGVEQNSEGRRGGEEVEMDLGEEGGREEVDGGNGDGGQGGGREMGDGGKGDGERGKEMNVALDESLPMKIPTLRMNEERMEEGAVEEREFTIATHFVKVRRSGALADVTTLWDLIGTEMVSGSLDSILSSRPGFDRLPSLNAFDKQSKSNEMLSGLRYFEHALRDNGRGQPKPAFSWGAVDMGSVARCFMELCSKAVDVFSSEPRLLEVNSPTYVLGDLHGNFHDLICFEKVLWRMGPILTPASFLFLGDYVDRGLYGFEVVAYIFAQKLLMPSKFLLIRGNHEIRAVQETFSYKIECIEKFGTELGLEVWEATNKAFDTLPIAAVIDKKVFCVHGGIPLPTLGEGLISSICDVPVNLPDPMEQSMLAWDIMWNDPIRSNEIDSVIEEQLAENCGFVDNFSRGTAHMFNSVALDAFLKRNKVSHVIRAHECMAAGFQLQQNGRLLTVFSSSHYCGATNEAACVLVHNRKIRTIRLDTT